MQGLEYQERMRSKKRIPLMTIRTQKTKFTEAKEQEE